MYGCADTVRLNKLIKLNNKILRIIQNKKMDCPLIDLYLAYNTLPIPALYQFQLLIIMFKCVHCIHSLPSVFRNYFSFNSNVHSHNTRGKNDFHVLPIASNFGQKSAMHTGCKLWNELPDSIKSITLLNSFKKNVKIYLLNKFFMYVYIIL